MIPFQTWLSQIIGYCQFIADETSLRRAWIDRNYIQTSVTDFDELYEQIFDDLDSDVCEKDLIINIPNDVAARDSISAFLNALRDANTFVESCASSPHTMNILSSLEWRNVVLAAKSVLKQLDPRDQTP